MAKLTQKQELQLLRSYFRASEFRISIGRGECMTDAAYGLKVGEMNAQTFNMERAANELKENTDLVDFIQHQ